MTGAHSNASGDTERLLNILLSPATQCLQPANTADWFVQFSAQTGVFSEPIERAILGGRLSASVGYAFASAYQSAIEQLFQPETVGLSSFCVTEEQGNHPRAIQTSLSVSDGTLLLNGTKKFVSGATDAKRLYVACLDKCSGEGLDDQGRPILKMVCVDTHQAGVNIEAMPALGFVPEISHGKLSLNQVELSSAQILQGDGYLNYVKPFRTVEDLYVLAAMTAYRLGVAISGKWPVTIIEEHISLLLALKSLSEIDLTKAHAHIALSACRANFEKLITASDPLFQKTQPDVFVNWSRDKVLLSIAQKAHQKRTQKAWELIA